MKIIIGALALVAGCIFIGRYGIRYGRDEQRTWEKIEHWRN